MARYVALLYSVVLGPGNRIRAEHLLALAGAAELDGARPLLATGNLLFEASAGVAELEQRLERAFTQRHGKTVPIIVRRAEDWLKLAQSNPFTEESARNGSLVAVRVQRDPVAAAALALLEPYRGEGEKLAVVGGDIWVSFPGQMSTTRLLAAMNPKRLGIGTSRNWNTVRKIAEALGE